MIGRWAGRGPWPSLWGSQPWVPPGHDGVGGDEAEFQYRGVDRLLDSFGGKGGAVLFQLSTGSDPGPADEIDTGLKTGFGGPLSPGDLPDLPGLLELALVEEGSLLGPDAQSSPAQLKGQSGGEVEGDQQAAHPPAGQQPVQHRRRRDGPPPFPSEFGLQRGQGDHFVHPGLAAGPVDFQVVHHHVGAAAVQKTGEAIGGEETGGIEQVGVPLARGEQQPGLGRGILLAMVGVSHGRRSYQLSEARSRSTLCW